MYQGFQNNALAISGQNEGCQSSKDKLQMNVKMTSPVFPVMQSAFLAAVIDRACALGADRNQILRGSLLRPEIFDHASQPIPSACVYRASTNAALLTGNPFLCAEIAETYDWSAWFHPPENFSSTPSLGDLLIAWMHYAEALQFSTNYSLEINGAYAVFTGRRTLEASQPPGQADAWDIVSWSTMLKECLGQSWDKDLVFARTFDPNAIPDALLPSSQVHESGAWGPSISFPSIWLMQGFSFQRAAQPVEYVKIRQELDVSALFGVFDYSNWPGLDGLADFLGMHPKALQRELARHGTNGAKLVDAAKKRLAAQWLKEGGRSISHIGIDLGYKNASAFTRACHRWFGAAPRYG